jgi:hypothetical protein
MLLSCRGYAPKYKGGFLKRAEGECEDGWFRKGTEFPRFKATIWTTVDAIEQQPLRAEVVTIMAIMAERHKVVDLRAHTTIPVRIHVMCLNSYQAEALLKLSHPLVRLSPC